MMRAVLSVCLIVAGLGADLSAAPRSKSARAAFVRAHPCPATGRPGPCPGYVVDHIQALACGGPDHPDNMQWQTVAEGKAKDRWELYCRRHPSDPAQP